MYDQSIQIAAEIQNPNVMELETLKDLYIHQLKDVYSAEKQLTNTIDSKSAQESVRNQGAIQREL